MTGITIPPEALEAAAKELTMALILAVDEDCRACALTDDECMEAARAACLAMLKAWPGMHIHEWQRPWLGGMSGTDIILPLTEKQNAEG